MAMMNTTPELITTRKTATAMIRLVIPCQDMGEHMDLAVQEVLKVIAGQGVPITGPMFCHHHRKPDDTFDFEIGFPVGHAIREEGRVKNGVLPAVRVVRSVYQGPYEGLTQAWQAMQRWAREHGYGETGIFRECYLNDPEEVSGPEEYRTELNWLVGMA